jgi:hypothetical protein
MKERRVQHSTKEDPTVCRFKKIPLCHCERGRGQGNTTVGGGEGGMEGDATVKFTVIVRKPKLS